jgi:hypothetical protein
MGDARSIIAASVPFRISRRISGQPGLHLLRPPLPAVRERVGEVTEADPYGLEYRAACQHTYEVAFPPSEAPAGAVLPVITARPHLVGVSP